MKNIFSLAFVSLLFAGALIWQIRINYEKNDNSQNWSNHEYCYNIMMTAEPNSIVMTEGGDNQVFGLLYFTYVEAKRPDIDVYDQKGNVFPRLYGDLMAGMHPKQRQMVWDLRDFQLYSTGRPVYLLWKRGDMEKLDVEYLKETYGLQSIEQIEKTILTMVPDEVFSQVTKNGKHLKDQHLRYLGPWYFRQYGILYKVTPLRYSIIDALEITKTGNYESITSYIKQVSPKNITREMFGLYIKELK
ncbi:MAG TPA: hypothetical protein DC049_06480, partial [Spirochaetia bacterium]|nr:hypothetical protein [Spirochaetia bacterium]